MAKVTLTTDQAVVGPLPRVCVRSGRPTNHRVTIETRVGSVSAWALLLVFLGPVGWLILLGLYLGIRGERLAIHVPMHDDSWRTIQLVTAIGRVLTGVGVLGIVALAITSPSRFGGVLAVTALLAGLVTVIVAKVLLPRIHIDATRSWITLSGVHRAFHDAVEAERRNQASRRVI